jgi:hypothetical protein
MSDFRHYKWTINARDTATFGPTGGYQAGVGARLADVEIARIGRDF